MIASSPLDPLRVCKEERREGERKEGKESTSIRAHKRPVTVYMYSPLTSGSLIMLAMWETSTRENGSIIRNKFCSRSVS